MNNLTTRRIVLGMLMTLVLAFSVQGIADALTLSATSDVVQSKRNVEGVDFDIQFSVGLTRPDLQDGIKKRRSSDPYYNLATPYYSTTFLITWEQPNPGTNLGHGLRYKLVGSTYYYFTVTDRVLDQDAATIPTNGTGQDVDDGNYNDVGDTRYDYEFYTTQGLTSSVLKTTFTLHKIESGKRITAVHNSESQISESSAHYFNDEAISITVDPDTISVLLDGSKNVAD